VVAAQVAAVVGDEMLVQEGAARAHRMLAPLLALHTRPLELQKALATMYLTLQVGYPALIAPNLCQIGPQWVSVEPQWGRGGGLEAGVGI
jgi:hypothetical protein